MGHVEPWSYSKDCFFAYAMNPRKLTGGEKRTFSLPVFINTLRPFGTDFRQQLEIQGFVAVDVYSQAAQKARGTVQTLDTLENAAPVHRGKDQFAARSYLLRQR